MRQPPIRLPRPATALAPLAFLALAACGSSSLVERGIENELPRLFGPAARYDVAIEGLRSGDGEADRVTARGESVRPRGAPVIDLLEVELTDVRYDRDRKRLERVGSSWARAWITASDLARFLEDQSGISDAVVTLEEPDRAILRLRPDLGIPLPGGATAEVKGRIVGDGPHIRFEVEDVDAVGLNLGAGMLRRVSGLINPLVDLSDLPITLEVTEVQVEGRRIRIEARGEAMGVRPQDGAGG